METDFKGRVSFVVKIVSAALILATALFFAPDVFLLIFAGILVSIFLTSLSGAFSKYVGLSAGWSLAIVVLSLFGIFATASYFAAPGIAKQFDSLVKKVPESIGQLRTQIEGYS